MSASYTISTLQTVKQLIEVQELEELIWEMEAIPIHQTITAVKNGGIILGAYQKEKLIGYSYGFPGFHDGKSYLCSHILGIHPDYQRQGIGAVLKEAQKREAAKIGYSLITWTYDPLESINAYLNLSKLRAICSTYIENCYGEMDDSLNTGLPTDRFKVEWWINSKHIRDVKQWNVEDCKLLASWEATESDFPKLINPELSLLKTKVPLLLPVPKNFQSMKKENYPLAYDWRIQTRQLFVAAFEHGYAAVQVIQNLELPVHYYVLVDKDTISLEEFE